MMNDKRKQTLKKGIDVTLYPLPFRKGGKIANANLGDRNVKPGIEFNEGGKPKPKPAQGVPAKPGVGDFFKAAFSSKARDDYRFARKTNKAMEGKGSQSFTTASNFQLPSGQVAKKGSPVFITPQMKNVMTNPGKPGTPGTPATTKRVQTGEKTNYTPQFAETGAASYGKPAPGAPTGMYSNLPANMNPELKTLIIQAIANQQPTATWKGKEYMAGKVTKEPIYEDQVTPGNPGQAAVPPTYEQQQSFIARTGGVGGRSKGPRPKGPTPTVSWLSEHRTRREKGY